jgi:hypothetical protein
MFVCYLPNGLEHRKKHREQQLIAEAAFTIVCYDLGYKKRTEKYMLDK